MNYLSCVSWGMYGGASAAEMANLVVSWGLMDSLPAATIPLFRGIGIPWGCYTLSGMAFYNWRYR